MPLPRHLSCLALPSGRVMLYLAVSCYVVLCHVVAVDSNFVSSVAAGLKSNR